ncbi:MAG: 2-C-methyl-D-erythritol 4-phosphate cytidylyltransferase, partial [Pseudomonadales bacterium]|nr:2-C-methyl-D-erythritol 4-phosphate cytidylyltransferase [Pseudomonadales bacterium]
ALTPQMFRYGTLRRSLATAVLAGMVVSDESSAMEAQGLHPMLVQGARDNIKITLPEDLTLAEGILTRQLGESS